MLDKQDVDQADWVNCDNTGASDATFDFSGFIMGATMNDGLVNQGNPTNFEVVFEDVNGTDAARTLSAAVVGSYAVGSGEYYTIKAMEEENRGVNYGFYNRVELPNTPAASAVSTANYDVYHIVATKDGSSHSQIHGVDNLIEIYIASPAGDADGVLFENQLNGYIASVGYAPVIL